MYQREGDRAYKADIGNIVELCDYLGHPERGLQFIHVGGTNGKGSVSHMLTSICMEAGLKTGTYTSPHYLDFRERIKVDGQYISEQEVVDFVQLVSPIIPSVRPSFFELTVAMAFWHFKQTGVDIAVIEVGLGGRLDSTNIIEPLVSVITNIGLDHQQFLGNTHTAIAREKAGIIKRGVPVVIGETQALTSSVFIEQAASQLADIHFADQLYSAQFSDQNAIILRDGANEFNIDAPIYAEYQLKNISTAYGAFKVLQDQLGLTITHFTKGLENIAENSPMIGRFQVVQREPLTVFDSAHNAEGVGILFQQILKLPYRKLHIIYSCVHDKDIESIIQLLPKEAHFYLTELSIPRKKPLEELTTVFQNNALAFTTHESPKAAVQQALEQANPTDCIVAMGSIFLIAELL